MSAKSAPAAAAAPAGPVAVRIDGVSKSFKLPHQQYSTLKERALHPFARAPTTSCRRSSDVSVDIAPGEFFGIVGTQRLGQEHAAEDASRGSTRPTRASIDIHGRLSPFIELGVGFNPELTARENVLINAIMLGLTRKQARERFDEIIAFAELEEFLDLKLKNYSSGMSVRLGFAVAIQVDADILLVDEVLAVGDAAFQQKCFEQFQALKDAGQHDRLRHPRHVGGRALLRPRDAARARRAASRSATRATSPARYNQLNFGRIVHADVEGERHGRPGAAEIVRAWFEDSELQAPDGDRRTGEFCHVCVEVTFNEDMQRPDLRLGAAQRARASTVMNRDLLALRPPRHGHVLGRRDGGRAHRLRACASRATATRSRPSVARAGAAPDVVDVREDLATLLVHSTRMTGGVVDLEQVFDVGRRA